ncbi:MAG: hypothetical protein NZ528_07420 [Caldilineales bacterium]|nr:hypothetical protein [Caldilineales bacterium]
MRQRQERNLFLAVIVFLLVVGGGLIAWIYGVGALATALICLSAGAALLVLLWIIVSLLGWWAER